MTVVLRQGESQEDLLRRFRKEVAESGILGEVRRKRWFISKSELKRVKRRKAIRRTRRGQKLRELRPRRR